MVEFIRVVFVVVATLGAYQLSRDITLPPDFVDYRYAAVMLSVVIGAGSGYVVGGVVGRRIDKLYSWFEGRVQKFSALEVISGTVGLLIGLVLAWIISVPFGYLKSGFLQFAVALFAFALFGYLGVRIGLKKSRELNGMLRGGRGDSGSFIDGLDRIARDKILDTSVIIDGRIIDMVKAGFIEGGLIVPRFVLGELQTIADSEDHLKRNRGRRGLDILRTLQRNESLTLEILERDYPELLAVDAKLIKLAKDNGGVIITTDYNLEKVAELEGAIALNLNRLSDALRPVVLPGEGICLDLVREGKESGQGVGYLDDGTMVVVDGGRSHVGREADVLVTSVLQTPSGRMIFSKMKGDE